jgi:isopropylmalate/homocitrate/citramalate synthase
MDSESHLTEHEIALIRDAVAQRRTPKTLAEGKWSVSPLNQDPKVIARCGEAQLPQRAIIRDITLRTAEQAVGVWLSEAQRRHLAEAIAGIGVKDIQVSWIASDTSNSLKAEVDLLHKIDPKIETSLLGTSPKNVKAAADAGIDLFQTYGCSIPEFHLIYGSYGRQILRAHRRGEDWRKTVKYPRNEAEHFALMQEDVAYAKKLGMKAAMVTSMLHYATPDYLERFAKAAADAGADEIGLSDGASGVGPEALRYMVSVVKKTAPKAMISAHVHNSFGLGTATAVAAIQAGAGIVEVAVNHLCSSTGQADLAEVVAALEVLYGVHTGIDLAKLTPLKLMVEDITGIKMSDMKAITGKYAGTYTEEAMWEEEQYAPVHKGVQTSIFGNPARYVLGRFSGVSGAWNIRAKLAELGHSVTDKQMEEILGQLKTTMEMRHRTLSDEELVELSIDLLKKGG